MEQRNYRTPDPATATPLFLTNPYTGKEVDWINRLTYPPSESLVNSVNNASAIEAMKMEKDNLGTKLFWAQ